MMSRMIRSSLSVWSERGEASHFILIVHDPDNADVFVDDITYVLIICTAAKATLLGLTRTSSDINLYHTNLQVDLPTPMITISGTNAGRIFMNGANKELFELEYSSESGWFFGSSTKIGLKNLSSGSLSNWVPSVFGSSSRSFLRWDTQEADR